MNEVETVDKLWKHLVVESVGWQWTGDRETEL